MSEPFAVPVSRGLPLLAVCPSCSSEGPRVLGGYALGMWVIVYGVANTVSTLKGGRYREGDSSSCTQPAVASEQDCPCHLGQGLGCDKAVVITAISIMLL